LWVKRMASRRRKTLVVCTRCHQDIHRDRSGWRERIRHWKAG
jgi:predicted metal-binding protein